MKKNNKNNKIKINKNLKRRRKISLRVKAERIIKMWQLHFFSDKKKTTNWFKFLAKKNKARVLVKNTKAKTKGKLKLKAKAKNEGEKQINFISAAATITKRNSKVIKPILKKYIKWADIKFRKKMKGENRRSYKQAEKKFYEKNVSPTMRKLESKCRSIYYLDKTHVDIQKLRLSKRLIRIRRKRLYLKNVIRKPRRRWQKKYQPAQMGSNNYIKAIKRWTNLGENEAKTFMSKVVPIYKKRSHTFINRYLYVNYFQTTSGSAVALGKFYEDYNNKLILNTKQKRKYKKLKVLRDRILSKKPRIAFKPAGRYTNAYSKLTTKENWLENKYVWLKYKAGRKRRYKIDFLKTIIGTQFLLAHNASRNVLLRGRRYRTRLPHRALLGLQLFMLNKSKWDKKYQGEQRRAWIYSNLVIPKRLPYYFQRSSVTNEYPYNKFMEHWKTRRRNPWLHALISKRLLYRGFLGSERRELKWIQKFHWIPFLRNKKPVFYKKNKLYFHRKRLLRDRNNRYVVRTKKKARIKQVLQKTTLPLYGHLKVKQLYRLKEKARIKKTTLLSREDIQLGYLERRLDVVVYRLNLAPSIFWARKLIQDGSIYVCSSPKNQTKDFEKLYAHYKHNAYPLKLRDPQNLYKKIPWNISFSKDYKKPISTDYVVHNKSVIKRPENDASYKWISTKLKFLLEPLRNINYLTSPGDVILCAPGALNNQYKTNKILWQKPVPKHLMSYSNLTETKTRFKSRSNSLVSESRKKNSTTNVGVVVFSPTFADLNKRDRMQRSFLRWMSL